MVYPFTPPSFGENIDVLVECLTIADKYDIKGAKSRLCNALAQIDPAHSLRVYAIAVRFGLADFAESTSHCIISSVDLTGIRELPDDFKFDEFVIDGGGDRLHKNHLQVTGELVKLTSHESRFYSCSGGTNTTEEVFRLRLAYLIVTGTPVEAGACSEAWVRAYECNVESRDDCVSKFISSAMTTLIVWRNSCPLRGRRHGSWLYFVGYAVYVDWETCILYWCRQLVSISSCD